ncbi:MAG: aldo/keto reductase [Clostridiales bacterium]|nr:aldo/keto reductase [Clostridiales bacterium]
MQKLPFTNLGFDVSRLGFGMMRLPTLISDEGKTVINRKEAIAMVRHAIDHGLNYVDTAYGYHDGESEIVTGLALKHGYREKVKLTTKLPQWLVHEAKDMDRLLDEQLKKLDVPYVDFYLIHALNRESFHKMQSLDYKSFLKRAKADGRIMHTGFSFHDDKDAFIEIVNDHDWDLAQIQLNYLDDEYQATVDGMYYAASRGIGIVCMEPLRGGAIANPPQNIREMMNSYDKQYSPVEWAFRYVSSFKEVCTILSGMSSMQQVEQNLEIFGRVTTNNLNDQDSAFIKNLKKAYLERIAIGCTKCNYCQPCPQGVLIPDIFEAVNSAYMFDAPADFEHAYTQIIKRNGGAELCVACGQCEAACPQQLPIIQLLQDAAAKRR